MKNKWQEIYNILLNRINSEELKPGKEFPTNLELMKEFEVHAATIQNAVNELIRDGLVIPLKGPKRRIVRPKPYRSNRRGDFKSEHGDPGIEKIIEIKILNQINEIPEEIRDEIQIPALYYHTVQYRNDIVIAVTRSYIPNRLPLDQLKDLLEQPGTMIYEAMKTLGVHPVDCEETLISTIASSSEKEALHMPENSKLPVIRITRKAFDSTGTLLQVCFLIDRADCYEFQYRFPLFDMNRSE